MIIFAVLVLAVLKLLGVIALSWWIVLLGPPLAALVLGFLSGFLMMLLGGAVVGVGAIFVGLLGGFKPKPKRRW